MAPEQATGHRYEVRPTTDIYALGGILYELLTGRPPFQGPTPIDVTMKVLGQEPVAPRRLQPRMPQDLETICLKCLRKDPAQRYPSAADLADDLHCFLSDQPIAARPSSRWQYGWRWCRRNPWLAGLSAAVLLLIVALAVGSTVAATLLSTALGVAEKERDRAARAEADAKNHLVLAQVSAARATVLTGLPGQRFGSLAQIREALQAIRPSRPGE